MVEDDVVLFAPPERTEVVEVFVVKEFVADVFGRGVDRTIDELGREKDTERWEL